MQSVKRCVCMYMELSRGRYLEGDISREIILKRRRRCVYAMPLGFVGHKLGSEIHIYQQVVCYLITRVVSEIHPSRDCVILLPV